MTNIKEKQNKPESLKLLAAQRVAYQRAKKMFSVQILLTVAFAILFNFIRLIPKEKIEFYLPYIVAVSVMATLLDVLLFVKLIARIRTNAAKIQEQFDCEIYGMSWNRYNCGGKADKNFIHENFKRYVPNPKSPLENWYDIPFEGLSKEKAILLCQETNLWYDSNLREKFRKAALIVLWIFIGLSILIGLITQLPLGLMVLYVVAPLLPGIALILKMRQENEKSVNASMELKREVVALRQCIDNPSMEQLRQVQDKIFCSRKDSTLVPEWFYIKNRTKLEEGMKVNASND